MKTYWAIENKNGKLIHYTNAKYPPLFESKKEAQKNISCIMNWNKGRPVKVEIRRVSE